MSYLFLFTTGFLISRLSARYGLVEQVFAWLFERREQSFSRFLLYLMGGSAVVSMFIPNFITALALLQILDRLRQNFGMEFDNTTTNRLTTAMALVVIYGCNIGGMGSLVGSPANAVMLGALNLFNVSGSEKINFISWFGWSLPLVGILIAIAWYQVSRFIVPAGKQNIKMTLPKITVVNKNHAMIKRAWKTTGLWFIFWTALSIVQLLMPATGPKISIGGLEVELDRWEIIAALFGVIYILSLFVPWLKKADSERQSLLRLKDCFSQFPVRGFIFVAIALIISAIFIQLELPQKLSSHVVEMVPSNLSTLAFIFYILFFTTMSTELFSNTTVSVVLFPLIHSLAIDLGQNPLLAFMAIGLASTNAFMLPIATPVNALVFGGVKNMSLKLMVVSGFLLNLISSAWMALFLTYMIPIYYG